jgi:diguanylate cyclase (GGDEF)-like protein
VRSYAQIVRLQQGKRHLKKLSESSKRLLQVRSYSALGKCLASYLAELLDITDDGCVVCVTGINRTPDNEDEIPNDRVPQIIHIAGLETSEPVPLERHPDPECRQRLQQCIDSPSHLFRKYYTCLRFPTRLTQMLLIYLPRPLTLQPAERQLLNLFSNNVLAALENVRLLEQRRFLAYQDHLLHIPSRMAFLRVIDKCLQQQIARQIVVLLDLDQFGAINDTIGPQNGDLLLIEISRRLTRVFAGFMVARVSGDTFGLLGDPAVLTPETVSNCFHEPFLIGDVPHLMSVTQGRVELQGQHQAAEVLAQANIALKRAKQTLRGGFENFHSAMLKETESRVHLMQNLRRAFDLDRLFMVYQPKIRLADRTLVGFEALMRWQTELGDLIPPSEFIPIAESSGLIIPLGEWALKSALVSIGKLREQFSIEATVAVNVSVVQLNHPDFISALNRAIAFANARYEWLELEITESFAMDDLERGKKVLSTLSGMGIHISIDDFGTGFSSLKYLEQLEVSSLKIDKSFVDRIVQDNLDTRIPETILRLGQILDLEVVAEGVETEFQACWLNDAGCQYGQGHHFARALALPELNEWIGNHLAHTLASPIDAQPRQITRHAHASKRRQ